LRFNGIRSNNRNHNNQNNNNSFGKGSIHLSNKTQNDIKNFFVVGTIKVDEFSRLSFTKKIKSVFPIYPRDTIVVYKNNENDEILFKVQRFDEVVDTWRIKKENDISVPFTSYYDLKAIEHEYDEFKNTVKGAKQAHQPSPSLQLNLNKDIRILIVDDEKDIIEMFKEIILFEYDEEKKEKKINIDICESSSDALIRFVNPNDENKNNFYYYDLIILDIRMPNINGIQLYQILKIINPKVNVLFISALELIPELVNLLPEINPKDIIKKPIDIEHFLQIFKEKIDIVKNIL
jgi:CheY-like chemotaxis protein